MAARGGFVLFDEISRPGAYLIEQTGYLVRVPPDGLVVGRSPVISITASAPVHVTRLSHDPWVPIGEARRLAGKMDLTVAF